MNGTVCALAGGCLLGMVFGPVVLPQLVSPWLAAGADGLEWLMLIMTVYVVLVPLGGLRRAAVPRTAPPRSRFAIVAPAHDEERVIRQLVDSCHALDYPRPLFDVYVLADNCSDATAAVARHRGANVLERRDSRRRGKGYALEYAFGAILESGDRYDAVVVVDADNLVKPNFLRVMNAHLAAGAQIIQGRMDAKNPEDTWVTAVYAMSVWVSNRFWYLAKHNLGLSAALGGTGMCISTDVLRRIGWSATSLTEDLEFTMKALAQGIRTVWAHDAVVYDEKPLGFWQSWRQRVRWVRGQAVVAARYLPQLLWVGLRRMDFACLDGVLQLCLPFYMVLTSLMAFVFLLPVRHLLFDPVLSHILFSRTWQVIWLTQYAASLALPALAVRMDGGSWRSFRYLCLYPVFQYSWVALTWLGLATCRNGEWNHTLHTRPLELVDLVHQRGAV